jgi:NTP pyrophosphatase (non-canonical NTP hydrolase)
MTRMDDKLDLMMKSQEAFMRLLQEKRAFPDFPVDLTSKISQKEIKKIAFEAMGELFEAVQELKNSKDHRATEITEINRDAYKEEICDSLHYIFEILILSGITSEELFEAYMKKGDLNIKRIREGY